MGMATGSGTELAFAIAHEVGNHLGGIRLQAHLVDEDLDVRELAEASILIDGLAGRSGPLGVGRANREALQPIRRGKYIYR